MDVASVPVTSVPVTVKLPKTRRLITYEGELQQRGYAWVPDGDLQGKLKLLVKTEPQSKRSDSGQLGGDLDQAPSLATPNSLGSFVGTETLRVSYDNRAGKSQATVFASSNQGFLHAFDDKTGQELFTFMPQVLLSEQSARQDSFAHRAQLGVPASLAHGKGSSWIAWRHDALQQPAEVSGSYWRRDGVITPSSAVLADSSSPEAGDRDFVMLYGVMGREGRNLYALDATNSIAPNRDTLPRLRFVIRGGEPGPYARLGQTWSTPVLTQMRFQGKVRPVLVFGGGYDATVFDELPKSGQALPGATLGNAVYVVDALSGALLWWTSQANGSAVHPDLKYSVPMSVKPLDLTGDGVTDRLYFGDIFGQVFRVQFDTSGNGDVVKIADLGEEHSQLPNATKPLFTHRLFFNAPSVATVRQGDGRLAVAVALGSGNLSAPLAKVAQDRLFVMYDPVDLAQTGASMVVTPAELAVLNLERNTTVPLQAGGRGWQMPLNDRAGEKIMVSPMIFAGQLFFASWSPHSPSSVAPKTCAMPGPHQGHLYSLSLVDGSPTAFFAGQPFESFHLNGISPRIQLVAQADALALVYGTRVFPFPDATPLATAVAASPAKQASLIKQASGGTLIGAGGLRRTEWRRLR
jgi:type IV pilus assembly protein PilY1